MNKIYYKYIVLHILLLVWQLPLAKSAEVVSVFNDYHELTSTDGRTLSAKIEKFEEDNLSIQLTNNSRYKLPYNRLSEETQNNLHQLWAEEMNSKFGMTIFPVDGSHIQDMPASQWAKLIGIKKESETSYDSSYRNYFKEKKALNSAVYTISAYAKNLDKEHKIKHISVVFANKGDSIKSIETSPEMLQSVYDDLQKEALKELNEKIDLATASIKEQFEAWFGESTRMNYGYGSQKEYLDRWDSKGYSFLLNSKKDELVSLKIIPTSFLEQEKQQVEINTEELVSRIETNDFGDVVLGDMPMVNQGPKGYCFPATCERMMRYLGIEADMYKWAMAGKTDAGGGTSSKDIIPKISNYIVQKSNSRLKKLNFSKLELNDISEWIDKGVPILWTMYSSDQYNLIAQQRTQSREKQNPQMWATQIAKEAIANSQALQNNREGGHICMIIGYNEMTNEVAVTDSWGSSYALRWVHVDEVRAATWDDGIAYVGFPEQ